MIKIKPIITVSFWIIFFLSSCDCFHQGTGIVYDNATNKPLDSVFIEAFLVNDNKSIFIKQMYTDTSGRFEIRTGFLVKDECKMNFIMSFSKPWYKNLIVKEPGEAKIILKQDNHQREYFDTLYQTSKPAK